MAKIIIVEDEQHNSRLLSGMIENIRPEWQLVSILESVKSTIAWLKQNDAPDLIFMDIQLADGICFSIFENFEVKSPVVFTTAYDEYAIQAFKVNSIDYLLKPIKNEDLKAAIDKFEYIMAYKKPQTYFSNYQELLEAIRVEDKKYRKRFLVAGANAFFKIDANDIAYFYSENRITFAVMFDKTEHVLDTTLEKLEEQLEPDLFFRANRSFILNVNSIKKIENFFGGKLSVFLMPPFNDSITISRLKANAFKEWLDK